MFVAVLALDAALKVGAREFITAPICGAPWLCLSVVYNDGPFGGYAPLVPGAFATSLYLTVMPLVLAWVAWRILKHDDLPVNLCIAAIAAGALGNIWDLAVHGVVIDYLGFPVRGELWAFANLADFAMVAGLGWLTVVLVFRRGRRLAYGR